MGRTAVLRSVENDGALTRVAAGSGGVCNSTQRAPILFNHNFIGTMCQWILRHRQAWADGLLHCDDNIGGRRWAGDARVQAAASTRSHCLW